MSSTGNRYEIDPDKKFILYLTCLGFILLLVCLVIGFLRGNIIVMLLPGVMLFFLSPMVGWYREYYHHPKSIEVQKDGILLFKRYSAPIFLPYDQIVAMGLFPQYGYGGIIPMNGQNYDFSTEIMVEIRDAYVRKIGTPPREWNGKILAKDYRRSIGIKK